ncbi:hypothetical protein F4604DRAFT_284163 [Suillus subluteus]|nr:hypothetical protein F4604DRAFT_284163 [Suillus subluteus]
MHSPFQLPPPPKAPSALSILPLLPPHGSVCIPCQGLLFSHHLLTPAGQQPHIKTTTTHSLVPRPSLAQIPSGATRVRGLISQSPSSTQALNSGKSSKSMSFDEFATSLRICTPSSPPVPAMPSSQSGTSLRIRTQSLLDHAATQRGQWPSPLTTHSRHPMLLPLSASPSFGRDMDLLSDGGSR